MKFLVISFKLLVTMNQRVTLMENPLSFSGADNLSIVVDERIFKISGNKKELLPAMEQSVNNYLKTPEEMEVDFCFVINARRAFHENDDSFDTYGRLIKRADGYINIPGFDEILSGPMEENY